MFTDVNYVTCPTFADVNYVNYVTIPLEKGTPQQFSKALRFIPERRDSVTSSGRGVVSRDLNSRGGALGGGA